MRVKAIEVGFYGKLRDVGEEFDVSKGDKASWFVPVDDDSGNAAQTGQTKPARQPRAVAGQTKPADSSIEQSSTDSQSGAGSQ